MIQRGMFHRWGALSKRRKQFNVSFWLLEYFWQIYPKNICKGVYLSVWNCWNCCARWAVLAWSMSEHMCCNLFGFSTSAWCRHLVEVYQNCTNATPLAGWCRQTVLVLLQRSTHAEKFDQLILMSSAGKIKMSSLGGGATSGEAMHLLKLCYWAQKKVWQRMQVENHVSNHQPSNFLIEVQTIVRGNLV